MIYLLAFLILFFFHLLLKMSWVVTGILAVFFVLMIPVHKRKYRQMKGQEKRFYDASLYMDTLLYSFVKERKIDAAVSDVQASLMEGELKDLVTQALDHMRMTFDETKVMEDALAMVEKAYSCKRISDIHNFMTHVEFYGGDIVRPVNLLLEDKSRWEKRIREAMQTRRKMWTDIVLSVVMSLAICGVVMYLPVMNIDISKNILTQILTVVVMMIDELILLKGQSYLAPDWLTMDEVGDDAYYEQKMENYRQYNPVKDQGLSLLLGGCAGVITVICFVKWNQWAGLAGLAVTFVLLNQHRIGRSMAAKTLVKGIQCSFPGWLMDLVLLLQSENVQVSLQKSREQVPGILKRELDDMLDALAMNPESSRPYHDFLKNFELPEIHSAMSMLFSLSIGNSSNADKQVSELIARNQEMMDTAQQLRMKDKNSGMYLLFLAPVLTASFKLVTDMAIFMLAFLTSSVVG